MVFPRKMPQNLLSICFLPPDIGWHVKWEASHVLQLNLSSVCLLLPFSLPTRKLWRFQIIKTQALLSSTQKARNVLPTFYLWRKFRLCHLIRLWRWSPASHWMRLVLCLCASQWALRRKPRANICARCFCFHTESEVPEVLQTKFLPAWEARFLRACVADVRWFSERFTRTFKFPAILPFDVNFLCTVHPFFPCVGNVITRCVPVPETPCFSCLFERCCSATRIQIRQTWSTAEFNRSKFLPISKINLEFFFALTKSCAWKA